MIAATGIYFGTTSSGAGEDPSLRGNQVTPTYNSQADLGVIDEADDGGDDLANQGNVGSSSPTSQTQSSFRIMEEQRAADRQEDLKDMIRYWNQLKKKEVEHEMD
jgi:hypothetical protein